MINIKNIKLECESDIAYDSPDHINPWGTKQDNSKNKNFNRKFYNLYNTSFQKEQLKILDLGCSGGGFIRECINDGCFAMGLEGSDYSQKMKRAEWAIIPEFLKTCDISKNFSILNNEKQLKFDLITSWEVLEHIETTRVRRLIKNIKKHLSQNGIFVASVDADSEILNGLELHQTRKEKDWWISEFEKEGLIFREDLIDYFNGQYIRGRKQTKESFHVIFSLSKDINLNKTKPDLKNRVFDLFAGSKMQKYIKIIIDGEH